MNADVVLGGAAFALAVGYYLIAATIPSSLLADAIGPQGLPKTYAVLLAGLSLILIVRNLGHVRGGHVRGVRLPPSPGFGETGKPDHLASNLWRVAGLLAIGVAYVVVVPWLGYVPSLAALIMATTYYQGGALNRQVVVIALGGAVVFWLLFVVLLGIPQPAGLWPSLP